MVAGEPADVMIAAIASATKDDLFNCGVLPTLKDSEPSCGALPSARLDVVEY